MQKSDKLVQDEAERKDNYLNIKATAEPKQTGPLKIKPLRTYNDYVAIVRFKIDTTIEITGESAKMNEGVVVGIPNEGDGIPDGNGGRLKGQLKIGDYIVIAERSIIQSFFPKTGAYAGKEVGIVSERNVIFQKKPIPFEIISEE